MRAQELTGQQSPFQLAKWLCLAGALSLLVACASKVPLTEPATVEDRTGQPIITSGGGNSGGATNNVSSGGVTTREVRPLALSPEQTDMSGKVVYFDFDSYSIKPQFQALIEAQAKRLSTDKNSKMALSGHTDELGGREYNLALGQKRAEAVKRALSLLGVQEAQLEAVSYGKEKPAAQGADEAAAAQNRRVELSSR
jgi:peptidoglycan-associated lipoprotein